MPFAFSSMFGGPAPNVVTASGPVANGTEQRDVIIDAGAAAVFAGAGDDVYIGGDTDALVDGAAGNDWLVGGGGTDTLIGAEGDDALIGGAGADVFVFGLGPGGTGADAGDDRIFGFAAGEDRVSLAGRGLSFADLRIEESYFDLPNGARVPTTLVTYEGGSVEFVNVAPQSITADVFLGLTA